MAHRRTFLCFRNVTFTYGGAAAPAVCDLCLTIPRGWTGIVGANGCGKTTLLRLAVGELDPTAGRIEGGRQGLYCEQRTDTPPAQLGAMLQAGDPEARRLRTVLGLAPDWAGRWGTLSHGERKRAQVAVALWLGPEVLALDEPSNHVDRETRAWLQDALASFGGIGLLVSHDRELLDGLCRQCVFMEPHRAVLRPGGYSRGADQQRLDRETTRRERDHADRALELLEDEAARRREQTARGERQRSKRGIAARDHDARARVDAARVSDGKSGRRLRQLDGRLARAAARRDEIVVTRQHALGVVMPGLRAQRRHVAVIPACAVPLGREHSLRVPALVVGPGERVGLVGPNGSGKSTLVERIVAGLKLPDERVAYIPQEVDCTRSREVLLGFRALPHDRLGRAMTLVRRLGSDPARLLQSEEPSPGEVRKLLLASCIESEPYLIVLDEPTNHLDLPSVECLEEALAGCAAALLLVSHDGRFLARLAQRLWRIAPGGVPGSWQLEERDIGELGAGPTGR